MVVLAHRSVSVLHRSQHQLLVLACGLCGLLLLSTAFAHDTWFESLPDGTLALGTGNQFPKRESGIATEFLQHSGCAGSDDASHVNSRSGVREWRPLQNVGDALLLEVPPGARSCWVQLTPFDIALAPDKTAVYIDEIRPTPALLSAWADMQRRGLPWTERYTKHARIELRGSTDAASPSNMDMDAIVQGLGTRPEVGVKLDFVVVLHGKPLPDFNVQFRSDRTPFGFWRRTDAKGRVDFKPPLPGRWLLRGVDIRLAPSRPNTFESDFLTLAFDVAARTAAP